MLTQAFSALEGAKPTAAQEVHARLSVSAHHTRKTAFALGCTQLVPLAIAPGLHAVAAIARVAQFAFAVF